MFSKRELEGYLRIESGAGIAPEQAARAGRETIPLAPDRIFESATINCSHCERLVVLNPNRSRSRGYCPKCDRYVCDQCEAVRVAGGGACRPFKQIIDEFLDQRS